MIETRGAPFGQEMKVAVRGETCRGTPVVKHHISNRWGFIKYLLNSGFTTKTIRRYISPEDFIYYSRALTELRQAPFQIVCD